ncbi:conserved hypothetical protein [Alteracholeplasma palmae J233]|uniref:FMN-binding domain-containing protein n=1 Tax=Alteracholeplasma palmae (strain ATCC 49389 / J233) TaxID=1318466 RepID=U4KLW7_ALTPJ|nr:hypothetical protein [Alteracholeplasma palmae]CCV64952.1 conserved hypothetical protein [Alteracholeplasma palmae J233]
MSQNKKSLVILGLIITLSILITVLCYILINPLVTTKEKNTMKKEIQGYLNEELIFNDLDILKIDNKDMPSIKAKAILLNESKVVGYYFKALEENSFGRIELILITDKSDKIIKTEITILEQTMYQENTKNAALAYKGKQLDKLVDANSGATSVSIHTLDSLIRDISDANSRIEKVAVKPYEKWFSNDYVISETQTDVTKTIKKVETILNQGKVYTIEKSGIGEDGSQASSIQAVILLDSEGKILGVELPLDNYHHTKGGYYDGVLEYAKTFINKVISSITDSDTAPSQANEPGNTRRLLLNMIREVRDYEGDK